MLFLFLFSVTMLGGLSVYLFPNFRSKSKFILVFSGSYLFSITLIHILPEVFEHNASNYSVGVYILLGFFIQQFLEYFSLGIEHGHFHLEKKNENFRGILLALILHSILEGMLLAQDSIIHAGNGSSILLGVLLHKIPVAIAMMLLLHNLGKKAVLYLFFFSIASPVGMVLGEWLELSKEHSVIIFAIVSGIFLHVSTTIFIETSPEHHLKIKKLIVAILGALFAFFMENL